MDLSIIIVNWNSVNFLRACLESIYRESKNLSTEIIVVDNASYDGSQTMIEIEFPQARYIQSNENLGFSRANNLGFLQATGKIVFFLNPDTVILDSALSLMFNCLSSLPRCGVLGCKLLNGDGTLQTSCIQALPTIANVMLDSEALRARFPRSSFWGTSPLFQPGSEPSTVEMISGAALMVRREAFDQAGMFTTDYFMYGEDADLCFKIAAAGWKLYYLPTAEIIHYGGQSAAQHKESSFSTLQMQESLALYFTKRQGIVSGLLFRVSRLFSSVVRLFLLSVGFIGARTLEAKTNLRNSMQRWRTIFLWSLGLTGRQR